MRKALSSETLPDATHDTGDPPIYYDGAFIDHPTVLQCLIVEMAAMEPLSMGEKLQGGIPSIVTLGTGLPNPFHDAITLSYTLHEPSHVRVDVHDLLGRFIAVLCETVQGSGTHSVRWAPSQMDIAGAPSGVFVAILSVNSKKSSTNAARVITRIP